MITKTKPIPTGYHAITPYLCVKDAQKALEFYKKAFNAKEVERFIGPGGKIAHAEIAIGDSRIMLADEFPEMDFRSPHSIGGSPVHIYLYVGNVDKVVSAALAAGAKELKPVKDQFYGDRTGSLRDPFGHIWHVATHKEDLSPNEIQKRAAAQQV